jgi:hypothetical protein
MDIESGVEKVWPEYSAANGRDYEMAIWLWSNYPMLNRWATPMLFDPRFDSVGWANISGYANPAVEPLVDTFLSSADPEEQRQAELQLYDIVAEEAPFVPLFAPGGTFAFRTEKYDGYQVKLGVGIHNRWTFLPASAWQEPEPVAAGEVVDQAAPLTEGETAPEAEAPAAQGGPNFLLPVAIVLVVIAGAVAAFFFLRQQEG